MRGGGKGGVWVQAKGYKKGQLILSMGLAQEEFRILIQMATTPSKRAFLYAY
jgi:hypothetical protein